jgi:ribosomal subunit interface protein
MIKLEIDSVNYNIDDDLRSRIVDRIGSLDAFMSGLEEGHVAIAWEGGSHEQTRVSAEVWGGGHHFDASDIDWKPVTAIDQTRHKLESQITGKHSRETGKHSRETGKHSREKR